MCTVWTVGNRVRLLRSGWERVGAGLDCTGKGGWGGPDAEGRAVLVAIQGASGFDNCQMAVYGMPHGSDAPESGKGF